MRIGANSALIGAILMLTVIFSGPAVAQDLDSWELGINYPGEDSANPFEISREGSANVEFFVDNTGLTEITVEFEFDIPFGGNFDAPEGETIPAGTNKSFDLKVTDINVYSFDAEKIEKFAITASVTARQGVPDPISSPQNREGDLEIPTIFDISVEISDPFGPMNAGSDTILTVTVRNDGNAQDGVGDVQVEDNCPLLTTDNGLDSLMIGNIESGKTKDADLRVTASESHPKRHCDITVTVTSKRAMNQGGNVMAEDEARVSVEPPPSEESESGGGSSQPSTPDESIKSNLPAPGIMATLSSFLFSLVIPRRTKECGAVESS
ncbi:MAG: hypothetical protein CMA88_02030 [Euryarchaeota archaeon]|nr:hypothetical protein [Euryarchaeota archaeon]